MRTLILVISTILSLILLNRSTASSLHNYSINYINTYKEDICQAANRTNVPPALLASVVIAEAELNRSLVDRIQDAMLVRMLQSTDNAWWARWQTQGELLATKSMKFRSVSNKWPIELWGTGYVQTFGSPQISPRTAIHACNNLKMKYDICRSGVRTIVEKISKDPDSFLIAGIVLDSEKEQYKNYFGVDLSEKVGEWATIYNVGSDYIIMSNSKDFLLQPNRFGSYVLSNYAYIDKLLKCRLIANKSGITSSSSGRKKRTAEQ